MPASTPLFSRTTWWDDTPSEQFAGPIQQLQPPLAHLDRVDSVLSGDLLNHFASTDRLNYYLGIELGTVGATLTHWWEARSEAMPRLKG
jgi:hypothetical protein